MMNVVVAGPCGVGKSTIAKSFAQSIGIVCLDFDELGAYEDRLDQVPWVKENYSVKIILFVAAKEDLSQRFVVSEKNRDLTELDGLWVDWQNVGEPYWRRCADMVVDTTTISIVDTVTKMKNDI